ncbi:unnamed protein product [Danaus chrysippus]|uniref:(African queen) hypothetical protein n=1 Tax=Danaus chrysippus TaxID=151541 RepID=A0A8J2VZP6_9NEOP|nr:unnamed protein product [Danaus chrysippus]
MYENCIENFFRRCDPSQVERHSDSSDFENPNEVQFESSKFSLRSLVRDETRFDKPERDFNVYHASSKKKQYTTRSKSPHRDRENVTKHRKIKSNVKQQETVPKRRLNQSDEMLERKIKNSGDQSISNLTKWCYSKSILRDKVIPCLSTIFRRSHNCNKPMMIIEEDNKTKRTDNNKQTCCPYCKRQRSSKKRQRNVIPLHPVYAVNQNIHGFPIPYSIHQVSLTKVDSTAEHHCTEECFENNYCSSDSEVEIINKRKVKKKKEVMKERVQSRIRSEFIENDASRCQQQQFPSKSQLMKPYQVLTSTSCQAKSDLNLDTTPSILWNSIKEKINLPAELIKPCCCKKPPLPCNPETCKRLNDLNSSNDSSMINNTNLPNINKENLSKFLENLSGESIPPNPIGKKEVKKKKHKTSNICKCYDDKKNTKPETLDAEVQKDIEKTCQENHDKIAGLLTKKYNGEILCIHNPPCILINGCLSLPPPKVEVQGNLWPVTQHKKSSFVQMCRKMKRTKDIKPYNEQSSQYHPPYADIKQCLPEFVTEKVIQSVCNHNPPCEVVHGCYKAKYDPRLHNSCIHVPSCNKVPQCLLGTHSIENNSCVHKPKCPEIPLCSRQYILLTAKESVSTQIQPKNKICRHEPPCFMIPKCLATAICGDYIPVGAIPGCTHKPSCEMIPACCRQSNKEMVSVHSQYPNTSCRIV